MSGASWWSASVCIVYYSASAIMGTVCMASESASWTTVIAVRSVCYAHRGS